MSVKPVILWFRNDLRLNDHPALFAATQRDVPIIPLYILDDVSPGKWAMGEASRWWLGKSLKALAGDIAARGSRLILRRGNAREELPRIAAESGATEIFFTRGYEPWAVTLEQELKTEFDAAGIGLRRFGGRLLREPEDVRNKAGEPYKVYTPFWRAFAKDFTPAKPLLAPDRIVAPPRWPATERLSDWNLRPTKPDWSGGLSAAWTPGEAGGRSRLSTFLKAGLSTYADDRNRPDKPGTSRLSPHLAFGEIAPAACWRAAAEATRASGGADRALETFLKELVWREFSTTLLFHFPAMPDEPMRTEFRFFEWRNNAGDLQTWQRGRTGYPIVDAGMRELWATGYMHNRVRMITASFLIKHLLVVWQTGEAWFWDTLVDADLANNSASWQWVAGSGADAAPYFRIFNPVLQGKTFDPDGVYVRCWVPELAGLPDEVIHAPWTAGAEALAAAGITLGVTYSLPLVEHGEARSRALGAFERTKDAAKPLN